MELTEGSNKIHLTKRLIALKGLEIKNLILKRVYMKIVILLVTALFAVSASAAEIKGGRFNKAKNAIELDVAYGGGCTQHSFSLKIGSVLESYPVQCPDVELIEDAKGDNCDGYIQETILLPLKDFGLNRSYYSGASLTIHGDYNTEVSITLP